MPFAVEPFDLPRCRAAIVTATVPAIRARWASGPGPETESMVAPKLATFANDVADKIATVYVNEALSAVHLSDA